MAERLPAEPPSNGSQAGREDRFSDLPPLAYTFRVSCVVAGSYTVGAGLAKLGLSDIQATPAQHEPNSCGKRRLLPRGKTVGPAGGTAHVPAHRRRTRRSMDGCWMSAKIGQPLGPQPGVEKKCRYPSLVLPAPLGPRRATVSPRAMAQVDAANGSDLTVRPGKAGSDYPVALIVAGNHGTRLARAGRSAVVPPSTSSACQIRGLTVTNVRPCARIAPRRDDRS